MQSASDVAREAAYSVRRLLRADVEPPGATARPHEAVTPPYLFGDPLLLGGAPPPPPPTVAAEQSVYTSLSVSVGSSPRSAAVSPTCQTRPYPCDECGKAFQNNSALAKHKLIHSDERSFLCPVCNKGFKRQDHLSGHMNVHRTVKPFVCVVTGCDKSYCDARSLRRHLEHGHSVGRASVHSLKGVLGEWARTTAPLAGTMFVKCDDADEVCLPLGNGSIDAPAVSSRNSSDDADSANGFSPTSSATPTTSSYNGLLRDKDSRSPVTCSQCSRVFKNMPALNGHMRLHSASAQQRDRSQPQYTAASSFVSDHGGGLLMPMHESTYPSSPFLADHYRQPPVNYTAAAFANYDGFVQQSAPLPSLSVVESRVDGSAFVGSLSLAERDEPLLSAAARPSPSAAVGGAAVDVEQLLAFDMPHDDDDSTIEHELAQIDFNSPAFADIDDSVFAPLDAAVPPERRRHPTAPCLGARQCLPLPAPWY